MITYGVPESIVIDIEAIKLEPRVNIENGNAERNRKNRERQSKLKGKKRNYDS